MKYVLIVVSALLGFGCVAQDSTTPSKASTKTTAVAASTQAAHSYTFKISGQGVTFSADLNVYSQPNGAGAQTNYMHPTVLLGATPVTYDMDGRSMTGAFTLNTGAGVLTILTYKKGVLLRTDTINTNATSISIPDTD